MRRVINLRTMLVAAVAETLLILALLLCNVNFVCGIIACIVLIGLYVVLIVISIKRAYKRLLFTLIFSFIVSVITVISFEVQFAVFNTTVPESETGYNVEGTIDTISDYNGEIESITLTEVKVNNKRLRGKILVKFDEDEISVGKFALGYKFSAVTSAIYDYKLIDGFEVNGTAYRKDLAYRCYVTYNTVDVVKQKAGLFVRIRSLLYERLRAACGDKYGSIVYCMLTGDKSELDRTTSQIYSVSGIGHILAVSGLHVGLLVGMIEWLLRKCKVPRVVRLIVIFVILLLYATFVGFTASVIRAAIMCIIGLITILNGKQKDAVSSLGFAYCIILCIQPFLMFEVGFLMSFAAVGGLILFARPIFRALRKIKFPKFIAAPISATVAVHVGILPISAFFFKELSTYSVIANLLLIPFLTVVFAYFIIAIPISLIFGIGILFKIGGLAFAAVDIVTNVIALLPCATLYLSSHIGVFFLYPLYFCASGYFMLPKHKRLTSLLAFVLSAVIVIVPTLATMGMPSRLDKSVIAVDGFGDVTSVITNDNKTYVVGDVKNSYAVLSVLKKYGLRKIDAVVLTRLNRNVGEEVADLCDNIRVKKVYCSSYCIENDGLAALGRHGNFYVFEDESPTGFEIRFINNRHACYVYDFGNGAKVLTVGYSARYSLLDKEIIDYAQILRCFMYLNVYSERIYLTNMPLDNLGALPGYGASVAEYGSFVFDTERGEVIAK